MLPSLIAATRPTILTREEKGPVSQDAGHFPLH